MTLQAQVRSSDGWILAVGELPGGSPDPATIDVVDLTPEQEVVVTSDETGQRVLESDGTITIIPPPPPPIQYDGVRPLDEPPLRTTDDQPHEVFRFTTHPQHVYRTTVRISAIDAGNGTTRDSEVRMVFKALAASIAQVGTTVVMSNMQDTAAASWRIQAVPQGSELVIQVTGALNRTIDWKLTGEVGVFAPAGLEP